MTSARTMQEKAVASLKAGRCAGSPCALEEGCLRNTIAEARNFSVGGEVFDWLEASRDVRGRYDAGSCR